MSRHAAPGHVTGQVDPETGEFIPRVLMPEEVAAEREFPRKRMYPEAHQEDPLQERPEPE